MNGKRSLAMPLADMVTNIDGMMVQATADCLFARFFEMGGDLDMTVW